MRAGTVVRLVAVFGLVGSAACGARLDAQQVAAVRGQGGGAARPGATAAAGATATTVAVATGDGGGATITGPSGAAGGPVDPGAGPAAADAAGPGACTGTTASDVGVTPDSVTFGSVSTIGGPVPGLFQNVPLGTKAYFAMVNAAGGVCGRKVNLLGADDRLDAGANRSLTQGMMSQVLGFAGGYSVLDDGGASVLEGSGIPDVGSCIGARRATMAENFCLSPNEPSATYNGSAPQWQYFRDNYGVQTVAVVWPAQGDARKRGQAYINDINAAGGLTIKGTYEVAITETNYTGVASKIKADQVDAVVTVLEKNGIARLAQAFQQVGYTPKVPFYGQQTYGKDFISLAGSAANGAVLALGHAIVEDAPTNPEMAKLVDWFTRTNPGTSVDFFAVQGWVAGSMIVRALRDAGPEPTRAKLIEALKTYTAFDADGLIAPINPPGRRPATCFVVVTVENQQWKRVDPASGFRC